jgi:hypothetical protein
MEGLRVCTHLAHKTDGVNKFQIRSFKKTYRSHQTGVLHTFLVFYPNAYLLNSP